MNVDDVKACLVALLSSTKFAYNLNSLLEDFEELSGCSMPLFGHQNAIEFLKSLPETLQLSDDNFNPEVHLIASKKSAHIVSLIDRQKISAKSLHKQHLKRRIVLKNSDGENWRVSNLDRKKMENKASGENKTAQSQDKLHKGEDSNQNLTLQNDSKMRRVKINENVLISKSTTCFKNSKSSFSDTNSEVNENVKNKLKDLIKEHCRGLWCCDLPKLFFQKFKYELNFKEFGYTSLINMLSDLPKVFRCVRPGQGDWILFDASAPPSQMEEALLELNSKKKLSKDDKENLKSILNSSEFFRDGDLNEILGLVPESEQSDYVFPNDVIGPKDTMVDIDLNSHVLWGERISIYATEVWSPSLFYVHLQEFSSHFQKFMHDLQQFYDAHINEYKMPDFVFKPKQICAGLYAPDPQSPEEWHRVEIVDVISERMVIANFVDFGTEAVIKKNRLRFLHRAFQSFPIQGIAASLAGITAFDDKEDWPISTAAKLLDLVRFSKLKADVVSIENRDKPYLNLIVYCSNNLSGPSLNKQLVDEKLARIYGTILISRDKSYKNFVKTNNVSNLVNSLESPVETSVPLEVYEKEELTKMDSNSLNKIEEGTNKKHDNCIECETKENKVVQEDLTEKFDSFDVSNKNLDDINFSSAKTVEQKTSNHESISTQNSSVETVDEDITFNNKNNGSKLEKAKTSQFLEDIYHNISPGLEATSTGSSNGAISVNSNADVTKDVSVKKSTNNSSLFLQNLKYVKAEKIYGKTVHLILKENTYVCVEEIIKCFTLFSSKGEIVNLLLKSRSQYFDFSILTWVDNKEILSEFMSCSSIDVSKKKRKKQKINILALSKVISFLQSLGCDTHTYATEFKDLQEKYSAQMSPNLIV